MGFRMILKKEEIGYEWAVLYWNQDDWNQWQVTYRAITLGNGKEAQTGWLTAFKLLEAK